jgi:hypothetical protein
MSNHVPTRLKFDYIKSNFFRVVHADGVYGGPSPHRELCLTFFNERFPIPKSSIYNIAPTGELQDELQSERDARTGIVREVEIAVMMDLSVAKSLALWLADKIAEIEGIQNPPSIRKDSMKVSHP